MEKELQKRLGKAELTRSDLPPAHVAMIDRYSALKKVVELSGQRAPQAPVPAAPDASASIKAACILLEIHTRSTKFCVFQTILT